jgi:hypothetical protein
MRVSVETPAPPSKLRMPSRRYASGIRGYLGPLTPVRPSSFLSEPTNLSNDSRFYYGDIGPSWQPHEPSWQIVGGHGGGSCRESPRNLQRVARMEQSDIRVLPAQPTSHAASRISP